MVLEIPNWFFGGSDGGVGSFKYAFYSRAITILNSKLNDLFKKHQTLKWNIENAAVLSVCSIWFLVARDVQVSKQHITSERRRIDIYALP